MLTRRGLLGGVGVALSSTTESGRFDPLAGPICKASDRAPTKVSARESADVSRAPDAGVRRLEISTGVIELGNNVAISTKLYNGAFPGPLIRAREGEPITVEVFNATDLPELLHWHGLFLDGDVDGAFEEGTPFIPARGARRITFTPRPAGFRFYHSHASAGADLSRGLFTGQVGLIYVDPRNEAGAYDKEVFLTLKEFGPYFNHMEMTTSFLAPREGVRELFEIDQVAIKAAKEAGLGPGFGVGYTFMSINGRMHGEGEPIKVAAGQRVLFHILNASATDIHGIALPRHGFNVVALDGNPVPSPATVPVLWLAPGERVSAIVDMNAPGVWTLGDLDADARSRGMGIVVEYADRNGPPEWEQPERFFWDYRRFAKASPPARSPDAEIELLIGTRYGEQAGFDRFTINGAPFSMQSMQPRFHLDYGKRYRLRLRNATDDVHPVHLHRHTFEVTNIAGQALSGLMKDVVMIGAFQEMSVDFTADQPGLSLFHCHMQQHMDFGFMALFDCG